MPNQNDSFTYKTPWTLSRTNGGGDTRYSLVYPDNGSVRKYRNGDNTPSKPAKLPRVKRPPRYELQWRPYGPPIKVLYGKKLKRILIVTRKGKAYWGWPRAERLEKVRVKQQPFVKSKKTVKRRLVKWPSPNRLAFHESSFHCVPTGSAGFKNRISGITTSLSGFLLADCEPFKNGTGFGGSWNLQNYIGPARNYPGYDSVISEMNDEAIGRIYEKAKNQSVNIGQLLAERNQVVKMIEDLGTRLFSVLVKLKKGQVKSAFRELMPHSSKQLANDTLMYNFGIAPLISDIEGIVKELSTSEPMTRTVRCKVKRKFEGWIHDVELVNPVLTFKDKIWFSGEIHLSYVAKLEYKSVLRELERLGLTNLGSVLYEVTPWSFVADWFIPIGNYINNLDAFDSWTVKDVHRTVYYKQIVTGTRTVSGSTNADYQSAGSTTQVFTTKSVQVNRDLVTLPGLPYPSPRNPIKLTRVINSLALAIQLKRK